jgi:2'-5' RNA ligase
MEIWKELAREKTSLKMVDPDKLHVTLKFLGDTDISLTDNIVRIMKDVTGDTDPFEARIRDMGVFPSTNYIKVVWLGVESSGILENISKRLNESLKSLGYKKEKGFKGHLTLARMKSARDKNKIMKMIKGNRDVHVMSMPVCAINLMKSTLTPKGPIYEVVKTVSIKKKSREGEDEQDA